MCGGGDDEFTSTAAKLIQPGENFDTTLNSTVASVGNYWFHLNVQFGSDSSQATQSFTATTDTGPVTPPSGGGGGGGGGGGNPVVPIQPVQNGACAVPPVGDFNKDCKVNSVDFSIMLAFWKTSPPFKNEAVDINRDGKINSIDFSILLSHWTKPE